MGYQRGTGEKDSSPSHGSSFSLVTNLAEDERESKRKEIQALRERGLQAGEEMQAQLQAKDATIEALKEEMAMMKVELAEQMARNEPQKTRREM